MDTPDTTAADKYRLLQAEKILELYEQAHGHQARTIEELKQWAESAEGKRILAANSQQNGTIKV